MRLEKFLIVLAALLSPVLYSNETENSNTIVKKQDNPQTVPERQKSYGGRLLPNKSPSRVPNQYIITVKESANIEDIQKAFGSLGITEISLVSGRSYLIKIINDPGTDSIQKMASGKKGIEAIQPNFIYRAF